MKIKELDVKGFGCLKDFKLRFGEGLNLILAPNDEGKSTLQQFITAILYPFAKERERFKPWTGDIYGGNISYKLSNGKEFEIHKMIKATPGRDSVELFESPSAKKIDLAKFKTSRGGVLFAQNHLGMDEESFKGVSVVRQLQVAEIGDDKVRKSVMDKIRSLVATGKEEFGLKEALKKLDKYLEEIGKRDVGDIKTGAQLKRNVDRLEHEKEDVAKCHRELEQVLDQIKDLKAAIQKLKKNERLLTYKVRRAKLLELQEKWTKLEALRKHYEEKYSKEISNLIDFIETNEAELNKRYSKLRVEDIRNLRKLKEGIEKFENLSARIVKDYEANHSKAQRAHRLVRTYRLIRLISVALFVVSLILLIAWRSSWILAIIFGATGALAQFLLRRETLNAKEFNDRKEESKTEFYSGAQEVVAAYDEANIESEKQDRLNETMNLQAIKDVIDQCVRQYQEKESTMFELGQCKTYDELEDKRRELENLRSDKDKINTLLEGKEAQQFIKELGERKKESDEILTCNPGLSDVEVDKSKLSSYEAEHDKLKELIKGKEAELIRKETERDEKLKGKRNLSDIESDLDEAVDKFNKLDQYRQAITKAKEILVEASNEIYKGIAPELNEFLSAKVSKISNKYSETRMDPQSLNLSVRVGDLGTYKDTSHLGGGMQSALYLILRIGIIQLLSNKGEEVPPLIMDEAFNSFDDFGENRLEGMFSLLCEIVRKNTQLQVIYFTCQKRGQYVPMKSILKSRFKNIDEERISNFEVARTRTSKTKSSTREKTKEEPLSLF